MAFVVYLISQCFRWPPPPDPVKEWTDPKNVSGRRWKRRGLPDTYYSEYNKVMKLCLERELPLPTELRNVVADYTTKSTHARINQILTRLAPLANNILHSIFRYPHTLELPLRPTDNFSYSGSCVTIARSRTYPEVRWPDEMKLIGITKAQFALLEECRNLLIKSEGIDLTQLHLAQSCRPSDSIMGLTDVLLGTQRNKQHDFQMAIGLAYFRTKCDDDESPLSEIHLFGKKLSTAQLERMIDLLASGTWHSSEIIDWCKEHVPSNWNPPTGEAASGDERGMLYLEHAVIADMKAHPMHFKRDAIFTMLKQMSKA